MRSDDAARLIEFVTSLSPRSRSLRGPQALAHLPADLLAQAQVETQRERLVLVATAECGEGEFIVGLAGYAVTDTPAQGEMAITVADLWQRQGLAMALSMALFRAARARGIRSLRATMMPNDFAMLALATASGATIRFGSSDSEIRADFEL